MMWRYGKYTAPSIYMKSANARRFFLMCVTFILLFQSTSKADKSSGMSHTVFNDHSKGFNYIDGLKIFFSFTTDTKSRKEKLEQVASFSLFGNVMSMASVQLVGASRDALLLSFKDAKVSLLALQPTCVLQLLNIKGKLVIDHFVILFVYQLSVVEYDPGTHDLKTLSLHYFEEPELRVCQNSRSEISEILSRTSQVIVSSSLFDF